MTTLAIVTMNILISIGGTVWVFKDVHGSGKTTGEALAWSLGTLVLWFVVLVVFQSLISRDLGY